MAGIDRMSLVRLVQGDKGYVKKMSTFWYPDHHGICLLATASSFWMGTFC
jgi:hypothetical protein